MKTMKRSIVSALLAGLTLAACDNSPEAVVVQAPATDSSAAEAPLERKQVARGEAVYQQHCVECHGVAGKGLPGDWRVRNPDGRYPPPPLDDSAHAWHHPTAVLLEAVRDGSPQGEGNMPAWKGKLTEQQMQDVVAYIKSLWSDQVYRLWWKMEQQSLEG